MEILYVTATHISHKYSEMRFIFRSPDQDLIMHKKTLHINMSRV